MFVSPPDVARPSPGLHELRQPVERLPPAGVVVGRRDPGDDRRTRTLSRGGVDIGPPRSSQGATTANEETAMKYILLIHQGTSLDDWDDLPEEEKREVYAAWKALTDTPGVTPGIQMERPETATTVRVQDGRTLITDGPFAETKDAIGGWCIYEADDLDAAIALAARIPAAQRGGAVEVRPLVEW
jgi:hypothetical protein